MAKLNGAPVEFSTTGEFSKTIKKINIGGQIYYLKDYEARQVLASLKEGAFVDVLDGNIADQTSENEGQLVTAKQVKDAIEGLAHAMHFAGVVANGERPANPKQGDIIIEEGTSKEYVYDGEKWVELGDESLYETKANVHAIKVAGVTLGADHEITLDELQKALGLGNLAYANTASGTVEGQTFTGVKASGTVTGTVNVSGADEDISLSGDYKPEGNIVGEAIKGGSISVTLKNSETPVDAVVTATDYTPAGTVSVSLNNNNVLSGVKNAGTLPSFTAGAFTPASIEDGFLSGGKVASFSEGAFTPASLTYSNATEFATEGVTATVDNDETLVFGSASKTAGSVISAFSGGRKDKDTFVANELQSIDKTKFNGGEKAADKFVANVLPTFNQGTVGIGSATFAGTTAKDAKVTGVTYLQQDVDVHSFTPEAASLTFAGTTATITTSGQYFRVNDGNVAIDGGTANVTVEDFSVDAKTVTVTQDAKVKA